MAHLNLSKPVAHLPKNGFDLSRRSVFSQKIGAARCSFSCETVPGGHYEIKPIDLVRTLPLNTAAFGRLKQRLEFFFVPYTQLFQRFDELIAQRNDPISNDSASFGSDITPPISTPYISLYNMLQVIKDEYADNEDFLFFNSPYPYIDHLNSLGYPFTHELWDQFFNNQLDQNQIVALQSQHVNMFPAMAYQKIWFDYYRNPYRDTVIEPVAFNDDYMRDRNSMDVYPEYEEGLLIKRFTPRFVRWKNDLFTASYPTAQFGNVSICPLNLTDVSSIVLNDPKNIVNSAGVDYEGSFVASRSDIGDNTLRYLRSSANSAGDVTSISSNNVIIRGASGGFSILDLRRAEALQKYRETVLRAGNKTKDNYKAHFGVEPRFIKDMHPVFLGSVSSVIDINEVTQTAGGAGETGELFGKGISSFGNETIKYSSNDFGIIMGILSVVPEVEYAATMLDPAVCRIDPFDFYQPEFANLGFEAIPKKYVDATPSYGVSPNYTVGFAPRNYSYKTAIDKVYGQFMNYLYNDGQVVQDVHGELDAWVLQRKRMQLSGMSTKEDLYVDPRCVDNMFQQQATALDDSDHLLVNLWCDVKAVLPMPVLGLPAY